MLNEEKAREDLQEILKGREYQIYQNDSAGLLETWWNQVKEWFADLLADMFPSLEPSKNFAGTTLTIIIIIFSILLLLLIFILVRNGKRRKTLRQNKPLQTINEMHWSYHKHLAEANKLEALNDYTTSTRHMFLALLLYFHEKELLKARIWKTNWEYYDELKKVNQQWASQFYHLALIFDEVTYGKRVISKDEYIQFKNEAMKWLIEDEELRKDNRK
ncbi:DUF4129 domain-containing protein [Metabacillus bambusae]|uniref:DUF4129 domain-containing protein n=1 Tax=Metabacillus bambusae TaxID=2795218 RepID=A0ABS3N4Y3_9BACI|nr:DUF4129 domain-containing protein [Metabacillus bambusae]MBO1513146.1 DUF4129 domain-containing protein [Metabacillus bambusae]